jgi:hypothetical protein
VFENFTAGEIRGGIALTAQALEFCGYCPDAARAHFAVCNIRVNSGGGAGSGLGAGAGLGSPLALNPASPERFEAPERPTTARRAVRVGS